MNKNRKWYTIIIISMLLLIVYVGYFFINSGRGLERVDNPNRQAVDSGIMNNTKDEKKKSCLFRPY